jgi:hypothetical protein
MGSSALDALPGTVSFSTYISRYAELTNGNSPGRPSP